MEAGPLSPHALFVLRAAVAGAALLLGWAVGACAVAPVSTRLITRTPHTSLRPWALTSRSSLQTRRAASLGSTGLPDTHPNAPFSVMAAPPPPRVPLAPLGAGICGALLLLLAATLRGPRPRLALAAGAGEQATSSPTERRGVQWAGQGPLSALVNALIASPLYGLMRQGARATLIGTAERSGVPWRQEVERWNEAANFAKAEAAFRTVQDPAITYPEYYTMPFHAYKEGNLGWTPAFECASATYSMGLRVWKSEAESGLLSPDSAQQRLRAGYLDAVAAYRQDVLGESSAAPSEILDVGCSVGMSTEALAVRWPTSTILGIDLSPYFLAVAQCRQEAEGWGQGRVAWRHCLAERTGLPDASTDFFSLAFVSHELPQAATRAVMAEAFRVLRPGGTFALTDNDPESPVIQALPPVLFTLMKSTEPWSDEYYTMDMEAALRDAGFTEVRKATCDPRHRAVLGTKPRG